METDTCIFAVILIIIGCVNLLVRPVAVSARSEERRVGKECRL